MRRAVWSIQVRRNTPRPVGTLRATLLACGATAVVMYFLDPAHGRRRRNMARDRAIARSRRTWRMLCGLWRHARADAYGTTQKIIHLVPRETEVPSDESLCERVESRLFRDAEIPKGALNINVEHGVVVLRGELSHPEHINMVERRVKSIPGVRRVHNLLHLPHTPAPNKARSLMAGSEQVQRFAAS
jgi:hypothetical protein